MSLMKKTLTTAILLTIVLSIYTMFIVPVQTPSTLTVVVRGSKALIAPSLMPRRSPIDDFRILEANFMDIMVLKSPKPLTVLDYIRGRYDLTIEEPDIEVSSEGEEGKNWVIVTNDTLIFDLSRLKVGNASEIICVAELPAGKYTNLQITVRKLRGVLFEGLTPGKHPQGGVLDIEIQDGVLNIATPFIIKGGLTTRITLDFDLEHSIISVREFLEYKIDPLNMIDRVIIEYISKRS